MPHQCLKDWTHESATQLVIDHGRPWTTQRYRKRVPCSFDVQTHIMKYFRSNAEWAERACLCCHTLNRRRSNRDRFVPCLVAPSYDKCLTCIALRLDCYGYIRPDFMLTDPPVSNLASRLSGEPFSSLQGAEEQVKIPLPQAASECVHQSQSDDSKKDAKEEILVETPVTNSDNLTKDMMTEKSVRSTTFPNEDASEEQSQPDIDCKKPIKTVEAAIAKNEEEIDKLAVDVSPLASLSVETPEATTTTVNESEAQRSALSDLQEQMTDLKSMMMDLKRHLYEQDSLEVVRSALQIQSDLVKGNLMNNELHQKTAQQELNLAQASLKRKREEVADLRKQNAFLRRKLAEGVSCKSVTFEPLLKTETPLRTPTPPAYGR